MPPSHRHRATHLQFSPQRPTASAAQTAWPGRPGRISTRHSTRPSERTTRSQPRSPAAFRREPSWTSGQRCETGATRAIKQGAAQVQVEAQDRRGLVQGGVGPGDAPRLEGSGDSGKLS